MISPNVYIISYSEFIKILVPTFLREPKTLAWLNALTQPVKTLYSIFFSWKEQVVYDSQHEGSVVSLEKVLNDAFDPENRGIYILNAEVLDTSHLYDNENQYLYDNEDMYLLDPFVYNGDGIDFTVHLPAAIEPATEAEITTFEIQIRAKVDTFKFDGLNYNLLWLN